ncbi:MAG: AMP-binding protein [Methylocystis sp.]|nr:AMP-binding protein [Methylocystis sp.]MCA3583455.1 AMP-binding protein [Methylocystis sp.]MCA3587417.1 AMP-binding protein [Methylocystis sp.]MCA3592750.1 AMP-binding protein [Methylocystis sp.]
MPFFDKRETADPEKREKSQFRELRALLEYARGKAPALKKQLKGIDIKMLKGREALAGVPVLRKSDLLALQQAAPPFAGFTTVKPGQLARLLISPGPIADPEGIYMNWWGAARALAAAGFAKGDVVLNTFSYHFTPGGFIMDSGAQALGCAVIPAGPGNTEQQLQAIALFRPAAYCGTPDFLKILFDKAAETKADISCIRKALVSGAAFPPSLQAEVKKLGVDAYQAYATADLGIIAYESEARQGLICNEGIIVEIVRPGTDDPVQDGEVGEVVVTRLSEEYPLLRLGTGDLSKFLPGLSPCGRTNRRLAGWMGRADQRTKVKGMFVDPAQVDAIGKRHPELGRLRLTVSRANEQDVMMLKAEAQNASAGLAEKVGETLAGLLKLKGAVELVKPGSLPNDGKVISDERG